MINYREFLPLSSQTYPLNLSYVDYGSFIVMVSDRLHIPVGAAGLALFFNSGSLLSYGRHRARIRLLASLLGCPVQGSIT